jgi:cytoskeleton protein RodZ
MSDVQTSATSDGGIESPAPPPQPVVSEARAVEAPAAAQAADTTADAALPGLTSPSQTAAAAGDSVIDGFGRVLAAAREARGIPAAEMAGRLRLHPRQLDALEHERLQELPSAPFVRGYVRSYAKELKIDPAPLLAALGERLPAPATLGLTAPTGLAMTEVRRAGVERASRLMVIGGTVVALVILAIVGWIASTRMKPGAAPAQPTGAAGAPAPAAPAPAAPVAASTAEAAAATAPTTSTAGMSTPPSESVPGAPGAAAGASPVTASSPTPVPTVAPEKSPPSAATVAAPASPAVNGLRLQVSGRPSWIEVTDAEGRVVFVGTLSSGAEQVLANLKPPLRLTIGNASTVTVTYRGRLVDLQPHIRANDLARLTLE